MLNRFEGKVIAIAGGTGGIGSACSKRLAEEGAHVFVGDINLEAAEKTAAEIKAKGGKATAVRIDIGDEESVKAFVQAACGVDGGIDGFYVNAVDASASARDVDPISLDMADYDQMQHVNMRGYFLCTRHALPELLKRGGGCMLYTGSGAAYVGMPVKPVYSMIKSGINALMRHVARRYGKQNVRSNVVSPGLMVHEGVERAYTPQMLEGALAGVLVPRLGRPEDIAAMAALLLSDDGSYVTGQVICVDGGTCMRP